MKWFILILLLSSGNVRADICRDIFAATDQRLSFAKFWNINGSEIATVQPDYYYLKGDQLEVVIGVDRIQAKLWRPLVGVSYHLFDLVIASRLPSKLERQIKVKGALVTDGSATGDARGVTWLLGADEESRRFFSFEFDENGDALEIRDFTSDTLWFRAVRKFNN